MGSSFQTPGSPLFTCRYHTGITDELFTCRHDSIGDGLSQWRRAGDMPRPLHFAALQPELSHPVPRAHGPNGRLCDTSTGVSVAGTPHRLVRHLSTPCRGSGRPRLSGAIYMGIAMAAQALRCHVWRHYNWPVGPLVVCRDVTKPHTPPRCYL